MEMKCVSCFGTLVTWFWKICKGVCMNSEFTCPYLDIQQMSLEIGVKWAILGSTLEFKELPDFSSIHDT